MTFFNGGTIFHPDWGKKEFFFIAIVFPKKQDPRLNKGFAKLTVDEFESKKYVLGRDYIN